MREYSTALEVQVPVGNLTDDVVRNGEERPDAVAFSRPVDDAWQDVTAAEFLAQVRGVAKGLVAAGVTAGDRVVLLSRTRYEWTLLDYAIWFAGAVTVPVYETSSDEQVGWILRDSGAVAAVVESPEHRSRVSRLRGDLPRLHHLWSIDGDAVGVLRTLGEDVPDDDLEARRTTAGPDDLATLIYTSGTTGRPKGCRLTHGNFLHELTVAVSELDALFDPAPGEGDDEAGTADRAASTLLFLPLAHVFARVIQVGCVRAGVRLGHSADIKHLVDDLGAFRPSFVLAVPRVFEKVFNTASQRAVADGRGGIFDRAAETAIAWSRAQDGGRVPLALRLRHRLFDRLVYGRLREALGGRCAYAVSGGAPLGERLGHFYRGIGVTVLEGYGLTETTAALTVNTPDAQKIGTVGRPLPGASVRVADDGELLFRGGQVFAGYWQSEDPGSQGSEGSEGAPEPVVDEHGWFHTGDIGEIDDEGFVRITGRKKEILVTAGGKNVSPTVLEDLVRAHPLVDQCLVVGDGRPFIGALVTLDEETLPGWAEQHDKTSRVADLLDDADLLADLQRGVDTANEAVSRAESIRAFRVLPDTWTEEGGQLTPSLKLRRAVVTREHGDDIDALYRR
ncbi:AMP-dependent synthetase/ligase [Nocardioides aurantiacus]|uniref:Acyl-CoA synthetase n=1 Tax=Nocardioides aurantiacus TaxID=86796 RepID=A0A3N2CSR5_9ACTN|nr:AMP-dependent synthetase/ligase [Nocardioides aurantiacus]ROR90456.1 long-chain acyl-CoA synthetase [Nocardioides aurantiacus]